MTQTRDAMKKCWEESFADQVAVQGYNTAPVEALARTVSYYLRDRFSSEDLKALHFLEMGCGAGPNLLWLARKGIMVSGVDISPTALGLVRTTLEEAGCADRLQQLIESSVTNVPLPAGLL